MTIIWKFLILSMINFVYINNGFAKNANAAIDPAIKEFSSPKAPSKKNAKADPLKGGKAEIVAQNGDNLMKDQLPNSLPFEDDKNLSIKKLLLLMIKEHCELLVNDEKSLKNNFFDAQLGEAVTKNCVALLNGEQLNDDDCQIFKEKMPIMMQEHWPKMVEQLIQIECKLNVCQNGKECVKLPNIMAQTNEQPKKWQNWHKKLQLIVTGYNSWQKEIAQHETTPAEVKNSINKFMTQQRQKPIVTVMPMPSELMELALEFWQIFDNDNKSNSAGKVSDDAVGKQTKTEQQKTPRKNRQRRRKRVSYNFRPLLNGLVIAIVTLLGAQLMNLLKDICSDLQESTEENYYSWLFTVGTIFFLLFLYSTEIDPHFVNNIHRRSMRLLRKLQRLGRHD